MSVTTDVAASSLEELRSRVHPDCVVCGPSNVQGLRLNFACREDGSVQAGFYCGHGLQGYTGCLHGGVVASLLDGAMANCVFSHGSVLVTAELKVRFLSPVLIGQPGIVRAWIRKSAPLLHILEAEIVQDDEVRATAVGEFIRPAWPADESKEECC